MGAGISGGGPRGAHEAGGRALDPRGQVLAPLAMCYVPYILKYSKKIILNFQGIWRTFIFGVFFYCMVNSENRQKYYFLFI